MKFTRVDLLLLIFFCATCRYCCTPRFGNSSLLVSEYREGVGANATVSRPGKAEENTCNNKTTALDGGVVVWDKHIGKNYYLGSPHCLDSNFIYVSAKCEHGELLSDVECNTTQKEVSFCPDGFKEYGHFCTKLLKEASYADSKCPYPYGLQYSFLDTSESTWLWAVRSTTYGIGEFIYEGIPRLDYSASIIVADEVMHSQAVQGYDCMVYNANGIEAAFCNSTHPRMCTYDVVMNDKYHYCRHLDDECRGSSFENDLMCFCPNNQCENYAEFKYPYQNRINFSENTRLSLCYINGKLQWWSSEQEVTYGYWSYEVNGLLSESDHTYFWHTGQGWGTSFELTNKKDVFLREIEYPYEKPLIYLNRTGITMSIELENHFSFAMNNYGESIFCFTDSMPDHLYDIYKVFTVTEPYFYQITFQANNSGYYWCQGYDLVGWKEVPTDKQLVLIDQVFAIEIVVHYEVTEDPTSSSIAYEKYIATFEANFEVDTGIKSKFKWMKTLEVNERIHEVKYLMHICTEIGNNDEDDYFIISENLDKIKQNTWVRSISELYHLKYCLHDTVTENGVTITWNKTLAGEKNIANEHCLDVHGKPVARTCLDDFYNCARWGKHEPCYAFATEESEWTNHLTSLLEEDDSQEIINGLSIITDSAADFTPIDLYLVSSLLENLSSDRCKIRSLALDRITKIVSNVMTSNANTLRESQLNLNATDRILYNFDILINNLKHSNRRKPVATTNIIFLSFDVAQDNICGLVLVKNIDIYEAKPLYQGVTIEDLRKIPNLEAATIIPNNLLKSIAQLDDTYIAVTIFLTDALFKEETQDREVIATNVALLLPELKTKPDFEIAIIFKPLKRLGRERPRCGYWRYGYNDQMPIYGKWYTGNSSSTSYPTLLECFYPHATHFGLLLSTTRSEYNVALDIVTAIGCSLSLIGILGIFFTAAILRNWREHNQMLIHYSVVDCVQIILILISFKSQENYSEFACIFFGAALQYTITAQFAWMLALAISQYYRCKYPLRGPNIWVYNASRIFSYIISAIPVIVLVASSRNTYIDGGMGFCYPSGEALRFGVVLPIAIIVSVNCSVFCIIVYEKFVKKQYSSAANADNMFIERIGLVVLLFFMIGVTWVFGLLAQVFPSPVIDFIFTTMASMQGFVLFLLLVVKNKALRDLYVIRWKRHRFEFWKY